jgi:ATP-dependent DNA ligase
MKQRPSYDYVCMGFEHSDSDRYAGRGVRSIQAGLFLGNKLTLLTTIGGLTDAQRHEFFARPQDYVGRVFEAEGKLLFPSGKLRHPNFLRWRDDKRPEDCRPPRRST